MRLGAALLALLGGGAALLALLGPGGAAAAELVLPPDAALVAEDRAPYAVAEFPWGPWRPELLPVLGAEGASVRRVWRSAGAGSADALMAPIRDRLTETGFAVLYDCADRDCGGFDFRFALDLIPAPAMHVDLGDYRYLLAARDGAEGRELVSVVTSRGLGAGYVHATEVTPLPEGVPPPAQPATDARDPGAAPPAPPASTGDLAAALARDGRAVLDGLEFPSGSAALAADRYDSLAALAAFMGANPRAVLALVGHTDAVGGAEANLRLSRDRAEAVRRRLIGVHDADPARILAEGAGWVAPVASNLTPEGRAANRRVEVVLLSDG